MTGAESQQGNSHAEQGTRPPSAAPRPWTATCLDRISSRMSPAQKVGQLFVAGVRVRPGSEGTAAQTLDALGNHHVGSVILMGPNGAGVSAIKAVTGRVGPLAQTVGDDRIAPLISTDQEGGQVQPLRGPGFTDIPSALDQGSWSEQRLRRQAAAWAAELRGAGINLDLAPVADVVSSDMGRANGPIGRHDRQFGYTAEAVSSHSAAFIEGFQQAGVLTTLKHFPGLGSVRGNTDTTPQVTDTVVGRDSRDLTVFREGIASGARFVMVSLATYTRIDPAHQAVFSPVVIEGALRRDLGFDGVVISDDLGNAAAVQSMPPTQRALAFLRAGGDLVLTVNADHIPAMTSAVLDAERDQPALRAHVEASVRRILAAKRAAGLVHCAH
ncbi:glycoside hydrolase family 3 N-terminal domain-containing protein [Streptomyces sp. NPDC005209]|uniref:glycoside hydrolase family 3 N-terminal domain-containing protein n=1 Tax=Streptomyces sp. NPDC005209 TaxID=3156715 RepID=UPI0033B1594F